VVYISLGKGSTCYNQPDPYLNKYTKKKLEFSTRVGTIVDSREKVLKQAGVVHDIKSQ